MQFFEELETLGVNTKEGLERVMGDEDLYEMMFGIFLSSVQDAPISAEDFEGGDLAILIEKIHSLKGTTGNLSITPLFLRYSESLDLLRANKLSDARKAYEALLPTQEKIIDCIQRHQ